MGTWSVFVWKGAKARPKTGSVASSIVPLMAMGIVIALAALLISIVLTSPATHANLLP